MYRFNLQNEYETILQTKADAPEKIEGFIENLKDAIGPGNPYFEVIEKIAEESKKRI